jgi:molybdate transport system substrate-binding protein
MAARVETDRESDHGRKRNSAGAGWAKAQRAVPTSRVSGTLRAGFAELVIGSATSGRTRWLKPGYNQAMSTIKILSGGAMKSLMVDVVPLFERTNGTKADIRFALTSVLKKEIEDGAAFDIALLPRPELDALVEAGKIAAGTQTDITRSAVGLAVRAGAPKPDIGTVAALRRTLQQARTIGYSDGPSGAYIADLLVRLGIAEEMKPKTRLTSRPVAEIVAEGEAEVGMQQIVAILPVKGAELVGPLPGELQNIIVYAAGIAPGIGQSRTARALIAFMATPEVVRMIRAKGMEPG